MDLILLCLNGSLAKEFPPFDDFIDDSTREKTRFPKRYFFFFLSLSFIRDLQRNFYLDRSSKGNLHKLNTNWKILFVGGILFLLNYRGNIYIYVCVCVSNLFRLGSYLFPRP